MYSRNKIYFLVKTFGPAAFLTVTSYLIYVLLLGFLGKRGGLPAMFVRLKSAFKGLHLAATAPSPTDGSVPWSP